MTEDKLKSIISKKYHYMIDWESTFYLGFHNDIVLKDNGQSVKVLHNSLYGAIKSVNWYLREIQNNPNIEW